MPKASSRPSLPTSSTDFALPPSSSNPVGFSSSLDEINPLLQRFRRPSLLAPKASHVSESRLHSPLAASFTLHSSSRRRGSHNGMISEESESDRERMWTDSSPSSSSENPTPPLGPPESNEEDRNGKVNGPRHPLTPPRRLSSASMDTQEPSSRPHSRRLSFPLKQPRILNLLAESRPEENEVKSEAAFQRLVSSCSELPMQPRTPRSASDRGRYPEEAVHEESQREETPSDDEDDGEDTTFAFYPTGSSDPINIAKPHTPANSVNGDDLNMCISESPGGSVAMDVDMPSGSPSLSSMSSSHWRYTPPPTTSAVRSNKRKFDDRFDPYPTASKRRAVSPSLSYLRDSHAALSSPITPRANPRLPIAIPISIPCSTVSSAASSPTITGSYPTSFPRPVSITSSPTLRASMGLASPILRPVPRSGVCIRRVEGEEREIEGAGEAVGGLTLG